MDQRASAAMIAPQVNTIKFFRLIKLLYTEYFDGKWVSGALIPHIDPRPAPARMILDYYPTLAEAQQAVITTILEHADDFKAMGVGTTFWVKCDLDTKAEIKAKSERNENVTVMEIEIVSFLPTAEEISKMLKDRPDLLEGDGVFSAGRYNPLETGARATVLPHALTDAEYLPCIVRLPMNDWRSVYGSPSPKLGVAWNKENANEFTQTKQQLWARRNDFPLAQEVKNYGDPAPLEPVPPKNYREELMEKEWLAEDTSEASPASPEPTIGVEYSDDGHFDIGEGQELKFSGGVPYLVTGVYGF